MPGREVNIPGVGPVFLNKRRGMRNIRISVLPNGSVRVNLPKWTPYKSAERFVQKNSDWINRHKNEREVLVIKPGDKIGRSVTISFEKTVNVRTTAKIGFDFVHIKSPLPWNSEVAQKRARAACEDSLKRQAELLIPDRVKFYAQKYGLKFNKLRLKKMHSRWGSCSMKKDISLSVFLVQLPDKLIDYVIIHELIHTRHLNHSRQFWQTMQDILPDNHSRRQQLRISKPTLRPYKITLMS